MYPSLGIVLGNPEQLLHFPCWGIGLQMVLVTQIHPCKLNTPHKVLRFLVPHVTYGTPSEVVLPGTGFAKQQGHTFRPYTSIL